MSEFEHKPFCWGCGHPVGSCVCEEQPQIVELKPPSKIMPFCGGKKPPDFASFEDIFDVDSVIPRICCACSQSWLCNYDQWINGTCPHCGASGADGKGSKNLPDKTPFLEKFSHNNLIIKISDLKKPVKQYYLPPKKVTF